MVFPHKIGMGTWPLRGNAMEEAMRIAFSIGYRLFDTADNYSNEDAIGNVITSSRTVRDEVCVMTKISDEKVDDVPWSSVGKYFWKTSPYMQRHSCSEVVEMLVDRSLKNLRSDHVEYLMMHWPYPDYFLDIWYAMREMRQKGKALEIGVCNCDVRHLKRIQKEFGEIPAVNQVSLSPVNTRKELMDYCTANNIQLVCFAPIQQAGIVADKSPETISRLTRKYSVGKAELLLMWCTAQGIVPIPKSSHRERLEANFKAVDVQMDKVDVEELSKLDAGIKYLPESLYCPGI